MIKIILSPKEKKTIETLYYEDACKSPTGVINLLRDSSTAQWLEKNYISIYNELFNKGRLDDVKIRKLLFADRNTMMSYISRLSNYSKKDSEILQNKVFKYNTFANRDVSNQILQKLNIRVCPYCNRQYIITLKNKKARPQWDHYYPKSEYPYLALSIYNLIPSCGICNMAKSDLDTFTSPILYPYEQEFGDNVQFALKRKPHTSVSRFVHGQSDNFDIILANPSHVFKKEIEQQMTSLHILDIYEEHKDYICDILKNNYINSNRRIEELCKIFPNIFKNKDNARDVLFLSSLNKQKWGNRPFAKLTNDILNEINKGK